MKDRVWSRRSVVRQGALVASAAFLPRCILAQQGPAMVKTGLGELRGEMRGGVRVFRGVPYWDGVL